MSSKLVQKKIISENNRQFAEETTEINKAPKIFMIPKNLGDIFFMLGEAFAWAVILAFVTGLSLYFKSGYSSIASNKYLFFCAAAKYSGIVGGIFLLLRICLWGFTKEEILAYKKLLWMDVFVILFGAFSLLSYTFSSFKTEDLGTNNIVDWFVQGPWFGLSGWYMGALTYVILCLLYFCISRCLIYNYFVYIIPVATVVCISLWGVLNRYNIAPIDMNYDYAKDQSVFLASIGNINWFCGFTSVFVPLIWGLYMGAAKIWQRVLYIVCMAITFDMIILNGSDSGYFALLVTMLVLLCYSMTEKERFRRFLEIAMCFFATSASVYLQDKLLRTRTAESGHWEPFLGWPSLVVLVVLAIVYALTFLVKTWNVKLAKNIRKVFVSLIGVAVAALVILVIINTKTDKGITENAFFFFDNEWGSRRGITWRLGIETFISMDFWHKLIGCGPDCFYYEMIKYPDLKNEVSDFFGGARLTNAHNELITLLVNLGLLGTASFVGILVTSVKASFAYAKKRPELIAFALAVISYAANNMFSFEQITNIPFIFIVIGMEGAAIVVYERAAVRLTKKERKNKMQKGKKSRK